MHTRGALVVCSRCLFDRCIVIEREREPWRDLRSATPGPQKRVTLPPHYPRASFVGKSETHTLRDKKYIAWGNPRRPQRTNQQWDGVATGYPQEKEKAFYCAEVPFSGARSDLAGLRALSVLLARLGGRSLCGHFLQLR